MALATAFVIASRPTAAVLASPKAALVTLGWLAIS